MISNLFVVPAYIFIILLLFSLPPEQVGTSLQETRDQKIRIFTDVLADLRMKKQLVFQTLFVLLTWILLDEFSYY